MTRKPQLELVQSQNPRIALRRDREEAGRGQLKKAN